MRRERPGRSPGEDHSLTQETNSIDRIAAWAGALEAGQVPPAAFALAKKAFLDTLAVSLSGSQLDAVRIVTALASGLGQGGGPCSVIGHGLKADVLATSLATVPPPPAHLFDDTHAPTIAHP